jgi:hypothetical protein
VAHADDDQPATRGDLRQLETRLRSDLASKDDVRRLGEDLPGELNVKLSAMEHRLTLEIGRAVNVVAEIIGSNARAVDEKYKDLPNRVAAVERGLEAHAADLRIHKRPTPTAPKRGTKRR